MSQSKIDEVQKQVDEVTQVMQNNVEKLVDRGEHLDSLQIQAEELNTTSLQFKRGANQIKKKLWWKDMKLKLILIIIVAILVFILCYKLFGGLFGGSDDEKKTE